MKNLFTSRYALGFVAIFICWLLAQVLFVVVQEIDSGKTANVVRSLLRQEEAIINPQRLAQNLLDLRGLGAISCVGIRREQNQPFLQTEDSHCKQPGWRLNGVSKDYRMKGIDGQIWFVRFKTVNPSLFTFALWLTRLALLLIVCGGGSWAYFRQKLANQALNIEREKALAVADLARQVAHDIRSPLTALNMLTQAQEALSPEHQKMTIQALARINDVANTLLKRGQTPNIVECTSGAVVDISEMIIETAKLKSTEFAGRPGLRVCTDVPESGAGSISGNKSELQRILSNLVNNSAEALPNGKGEIIISARKYSNETQIAVRDAGVGIPSEILERVFDKGFSFGKGSQASGSGLGLYHAKRVVEAMSGKLSISSKPGVGTIISIAIPSY